MYNYDLAKFMIKNALKYSNFEGSLFNCHTKGLDSLVLFDQRHNNLGMLRIFVAQPNKHELGELMVDNNFVIGPHDHRFNLTIVPLVGTLNNVLFYNYIPSPFDSNIMIRLYEHEFTSCLLTGEFKTKFIQESPKYMTTKSYCPGQEIDMWSDVIHTVQVADSKELTAWMLFEGPDIKPNTKIYSYNQELKLSSEGLYENMTAASARFILNDIWSRME